MASFIQESLRDLLKCLGLAEKSVDDDENVVINPQSTSDVTISTTTYEPLASKDTMDPLVEVLSSPIDKSAVSLITIDDVINTNEGTLDEANYGEPKMNITTRGISSRGGGQHN